MLYLIFNEGYTASGGDQLYRIDLSIEAIRVARLLSAAAAGRPEVGGLLALMLLTDARRAGAHRSERRADPARRAGSIAVEPGAHRGRRADPQRALARGAVGPYQIQAAIAALHDEAPSTDATDWPQILALYELLLRFQDSPMARLSHAIALAMVDGPAAGLRALDDLAGDPAFRDPHRLDAAARTPARARRRPRRGDRDYRRAAQRTTSTPERNYLLLHAARLNDSLTPSR